MRPLAERISCRNCGKEIEHSAFGWIHRWSLSIWCSLAGLARAEP